MNANIFSRVRPDLLLSLWSHFSRRRQWQFGLLLVLMLVSALVEVATLGAVLPFLAVLTTPERVFRHPFVAYIAQAFSLPAADQLVLPITIAFATAAMIAGAIRLIFCGPAHDWHMLQAQISVLRCIAVRSISLIRCIWRATAAR